MTSSNTIVPLATPTPRSRFWLWMLTGILPTALTAWVLVALLARDGQAGTMTLWVAALAALPFLLVAAVLDSQARRQRLRIEGSGLRVVTSGHRQQLTWDALELDRARVLDLAERIEFKPAHKRSGSWLPGIQSGWYTLRNGNRAFVARAGGSRMLWIPTRSGFDLLLQAQRPQDLLRSLHAAAASGNIQPAAPTASDAPGSRYWFPAKQYGWGWGIPATWQGWAVLLGWIAGLILWLTFLSDRRYEFPGVAVLIAAMLLVCLIKGEPPRWRWGDDDD